MIQKYFYESYSSTQEGLINLRINHLLQTEKFIKIKLAYYTAQTQKAFTKQIQKTYFLLKTNRADNIFLLFCNL